MNRKAFGASFLHWVDFTRITRTPKKSVIYYVYIFINKIQLRILHVQQITTCYNLPSNFLSDFNDDIINFNCFHPVYLQLIGIDLSQMRSLFWREELYIVGTYLKLIYSEKAAKFCEIFPLFLTTVHTVKSKGKISQDFVAFSEYMNFNLLGLLQFTLVVAG